MSVRIQTYLTASSPVKMLLPTTDVAAQRASSPTPRTPPSVLVKIHIFVAYFIFRSTQLGYSFITGYVCQSAL